MPLIMAELFQDVLMLHTNYLLIHWSIPL